MKRFFCVVAVSSLFAGNLWAGEGGGSLVRQLAEVKNENKELKDSLAHMLRRLEELEGLQKQAALPSSPVQKKSSDKSAKSEDAWKFYGVAHLSLMNFDFGSSLGDRFRLDSNSSRLGFKGHHSLTKERRAFWQIEAGIKGLDGAGASDLTGRNSFAGIEWKNSGSILLGKHDTPYKFAGKDINVYADTVGDYNSILGQTSNGKLEYEERLPIVMWESQKKKTGFHYAFSYSDLSETDVSKPSGSEDDEDVFSAMMDYKKKNWTFFAAYESHDAKNATAAVNTTFKIPGDATKLGWMYKNKGTTYGFAWESLSVEDSANLASERDAWYASVSHKSGKNTFKLGYAMADDSKKAGAEDGADMIVAGVDHALSKNMTVWVMYTKIGNDPDARYTFHDPDSGNLTTPTKGEDADAFGFGLRYQF